MFYTGWGTIARTPGYAQPRHLGGGRPSRALLIDTASLFGTLDSVWTEKELVSGRSKSAKGKQQHPRGTSNFPLATRNTMTPSRALLTLVLLSAAHAYDKPFYYYVRSVVAVLNFHYCSPP